LQQTQALTVLEARWVAPMTAGCPVLERHAVVLQDSNIINVLPIDFAREQYPSAQRVSLAEHLLLPGLINTHSHSAMSLMRGLAGDLPLMSWLQDYIWPVEKQFVSERFVRDGSLLACAEMLKSGITTFNDMYFYPQAIAEAANQSGMRAQIGLVVMDFATNYANDADDYLQKGFEFRDAWREQDLITSSLAPHAPYTLSNDSFAQVITYAEQLNLGIHTHLHETRQEIEASIKQYGLTPITRMAELGLLGPNLLAAHCVHLSEADLALLQAHGCHIAHCPSSNLKLASGIAPVTDMLGLSINVSLGTDGAASNNRLDIMSEMRMAALLAKVQSDNAASVSAQQALAMATINGAKALGLDDKIGSIEIGKYGDLCAVNMAHYETMPCFDPISHMVYAAGREHVSHVWVHGVLQYQKLMGQEGVYANIEPLELKEISTSWQSRLSQYQQKNH
jgi:5-methylthioadenosine/S-adenosylhomocysteine deaminase